MKKRPDKTAKETMIAAIRIHGANGCIEALAKALADLGPEWTERCDLPKGHADRREGPANGLEVVLGYSPHRLDDYRGAARCGECASCQEWLLTPDQAPGCFRRYANGRVS